MNVIITNEIEIPVGELDLAYSICKEIRSDFPDATCTIIINEDNSLLRIETNAGSKFGITEGHMYTKRLWK